MTETRVEIVVETVIVVETRIVSGTESAIVTEIAIVPVTETVTETGSSLEREAPLALPTAGSAVEAEQANRRHVTVAGTMTAVRFETATGKHVNCQSSLSVCVVPNNSWQLLAEAC
jgi:hypothetical protein